MAVTFHNISINYIPVRAHKNSNTFIFSISQEMLNSNSHCGKYYYGDRKSKIELLRSIFI